mmetsp:Transcript_3987/g.14822  ORF Transcript_3987/g.14822 Transcript_3987/m.14822 type:complete len:292 (-) Transcript_3987:1594-2469(-)
MLAQPLGLRVHGRAARRVRLRPRHRPGRRGCVGGEHVHREESEPERDEHRHHQGKGAGKEVGHRGMRPPGRQEGEGARGLIPHRRDSDRSHRGRGGAHARGRRRAVAGEETPAVARPAEGAQERARRDFAALHRVPRAVHLLQDQARARRAGELLARGARTARADRDRGGRHGDLAVLGGHRRVRHRPRHGHHPTAQGSHRGAPRRRQLHAATGHDQPAVHPGALGRRRGGHAPPWRLRVFAHSRAGGLGRGVGSNEARIRRRRLLYSRRRAPREGSRDDHRHGRHMRVPR